MAQEDYYYEIQLTNKQLVAYFLAGATGLILSFLAGVMVGRGVESPKRDDAVAEISGERIVSEEPPLTSEDLSYTSGLDDDAPTTTLETAPVRPAVTSTTTPPRPATTTPPKATTPRPTPRPTPAPTPAPAPSTIPRAVPPGANAAPVYSIQVGAFKDRAAADSLAGRLKKKNYEAYVVSPNQNGGLFNVRVGRYSARVDAESVRNRLRDQENFKPFIVTR